MHINFDAVYKAPMRKLQQDRQELNGLENAFEKAASKMDYLKTKSLAGRAYSQAIKCYFGLGAIVSGLDEALNEASNNPAIPEDEKKILKYYRDFTKKQFCKAETIMHGYKSLLDEIACAADIN
jgi:hypothetical protein